MWIGCWQYEEPGRPQILAMKPTCHKPESVFKRCAIADQRVFLWVG